MSEPDTTSTLEEELHALAAPIRERYERVEAELQEAQNTVERLKADRQKIRAALRAVDPTFEPDHGHKPGVPKAKRNGSRKLVSRASVDEVARLLEARRDELANGGGFTATELARWDGWPLSQSSTSAALRTLHERGVVRLDHTGTGGGKWYALV